MYTKYTIGQYDVEVTTESVYYEHIKMGEDKSGRITIDNKEIVDFEGDFDIPLPVVALLYALDIIHGLEFKEQMHGRYQQK